MIFLLKLILAHLIGDFLLQPTSWVREKERKKAASPKIYLHIIIHTVLLLLLLWDLELWLPVLIIAGSHLIIDLAKLYFQKKKTRRRWFFIDQGLHLLVIFAVFLFWKNLEIDLSILLSPAVLAFVTAAVFLSFPTAVMMRMMLHRFSAQISDAEDESLANAGTYIGILERLLILIFILTNHWEAVGFLIAAKSVFRFGDLKESKDRKLTEYILIGTLLSFGTAIITALIVQQLIFLI